MAKNKKKAEKHEFKSKENDTKKCQKYINCVDLHAVYFPCHGPFATQTKCEFIQCVVTTYD